MSPTPLWTPPESLIESCNLTQFAKGIGFAPPHYAALHRWSIDNRAEFWREAWDFLGVIGVPGNNVLINGEDFLKNKWFPNARLNYAENLLRRSDDAPAVISHVESKERVSLTYRELRTKTAQFAAELRSRGVKPGDRVAAYLPNVPETLIAMLGTASIGAVWSSCSPDFGFQGAIDRFGQISPKLLLAADGYIYNGKEFRTLDNARRIANEVPSIEDLLLLRSLDGTEDNFSVVWQRSETDLEFERFAFDHPLFIMYSSGTTGRPKCIVHGIGGTLLQHMKEHQLHVNLRANSRIFFFTTCGWMMWNWLVSALASGSTIVLYDGSPFRPQPGSLIDLIEKENLMVFGAGAKYYSSLENAGVRNTAMSDPSNLESIQSTGSPLSPESFDYIYRNISPSSQLASITGGTDLMGCFALGVPWLPVHRGEIQGPGLGMAVDVFDESGSSVSDAKGELVCTKSFPSKPIGFWNDPDDQEYRSAYFETYPNIWAHGDFAEVSQTTQGMVIHGRSDAVLNPGGVRIGTAEIYRQVESMEEIEEALCIGQSWQDDTRVVLFVVLAGSWELDEELSTRIKQRIRANASPRHVPAVILQVSDIPRTRSGKIAELAVRDVVHGRAINNTSALANPESLDQFVNREELNPNLQ